MDEQAPLAVRDTSFRGADSAAPADHRALSLDRTCFGCDWSSILGGKVDAKSCRQQDIWDSLRRQTEGDDRPGICSGTGGRDAASQHDSRNLGL